VNADQLSQEVTYFSYDINRKFHPDASSLQYFYPPTLPVDLCKGYESFIRWDDSTDEHLDGLLKAVELLEEKTGERVKVDVITWRGMMTKVGWKYLK
jgi:RAT1-interacting protein